jgi:sugar O-acyltransferase (sialic acid O-acetyltransferase NeuD family)
VKKLVIVGTGLFAQVVWTYFRHAGEYDVVAFSAEREYAKQTPQFCGVPVVEYEELEKHFAPEVCDLFVAVGFRELNQIRARLFSSAKARGYTCASYVHASVIRWPETKFGENVFVFEDNTIQPFVTVGDDSIFWSGNHIGHHSNIGQHCFITSHVVISGNCSVGDFSFVGVNATVRDNVKIGARNIIGPGSLILKNTQDAQVFLPKGTEPRDLPSDRVKL